MEKLFYVCKHCGRLFSGNGERLRGVMCIGCCEQATYLCTFSWWGRGSISKQGEHWSRSMRPVSS